MSRRLRPFYLAVVLCLLAGLTLAQRGDRRYRGDPRNGVPTWDNDEEMPNDIFTFTRVEYSSGRGGGRGGRWATDYPDADLNFSYRLNEMTSINMHPNGEILQLSEDRLFDHPFIYIIEPGDLSFHEDEVENLRRYLLNGGFLMVDDFWGEREWDNFYFEIKRVFPEREPEEIPYEHPIFHMVFPLEEKPQVPSIRMAQRGRYDGVTWERSDAQEPHYRAIYDDNGRMMAIICHNTDLGDGWEREGEDPWYFREFSEKSAYPLGINILFYAMTH